jgi:heat shock protein HtpX
MDAIDETVEYLPYLFPFWVVVAIIVSWATDGRLAPFIIPTVITLALVPVIVATDKVEGMIFTLYFVSIPVLFFCIAIEIIPFFKDLVWYIIGQPIASLLTYTVAVPGVVSTIVLGIAGIAAVGILCTLWRAGPTTDPFLVSRMVISLVLLTGVTLGFFVAVWRVIEFTIWAPGSFIQIFALSEAQNQVQSEPWRNAAILITGIMLVSFTCREFARMSVVDRRPDAVTVSPEQYPTLHEITTTLSLQFDISKPTVAITKQSEPEAMAVGYRPGNIYLIVSEGLLDALNEEELEAVIAHELAHVANMDAIVMTIASLPIHFAEGLKHRVNVLKQVEDPNTDRDRNGLLSLLRRLLVLVIRSPILISWYIIERISALLSYLTDESPHHLYFDIFLAIVYFTKLCSRPPIAVLSRARESTADRTAVTVTGSPAALASALRTLDEQITEIPSEDLREASSLSSLSILPLDPIDVSSDQELDSIGTGRNTVWAHTKRFLFATHPPTTRRIETLNDQSSKD